MSLHKETTVRITTLKKNFDNIKLLNNDITHIFDNLKTKTNKLKDIYKHFLDENKNTLFIFGLDSFKFQNRLIDEELETLNRYYNLICNRIYCDYYKLYQLVNNFINNDESLVKMHKIKTRDKYERYNYLDIYKYYDIQSSSDIFSDIISLITSLCDHSKSEMNTIKNYNNKKQFGLNINNFIYTHMYKNTILNEKITLYINYLSFFIKLHLKYVFRFMSKIKLVYSQVNTDIDFENTDNEIRNFSENIVLSNSSESSSNISETSSIISEAQPFVELEQKINNSIEQHDVNTNSKIRTIDNGVIVNKYHEIDSNVSNFIDENERNKKDNLHNMEEKTFNFDFSLNIVKDMLNTEVNSSYEANTIIIDASGNQETNVGIGKKKKTRRGGKKR